MNEDDWLFGKIWSPLRQNSPKTQRSDPVSSVQPILSNPVAFAATREHFSCSRRQVALPVGV